MLRTQGLVVAIAMTSGLICPAGEARAYTAYVSNEKGNSVTVLDSATLISH